MLRKWRELAFVAGQQYRLDAGGFDEISQADAERDAPFVAQGELKRTPII